MALIAAMYLQPKSHRSWDLSFRLSSSADFRSGGLFWGKFEVAARGVLIMSPIKCVNGGYAIG